MELELKSDWFIIICHISDLLSNIINSLQYIGYSSIKFIHISISNLRSFVLFLSINCNLLLDLFQKLAHGIIAQIETVAKLRDNRLWVVSIVNTNLFDVVSICVELNFQDANWRCLVYELFRHWAAGRVAMLAYGSMFIVMLWREGGAVLAERSVVGAVMPLILLVLR